MPPLVIADQGFFWVGVTRAALGTGIAAAGQTFVAYQIPAERRHKLPLVLVHGGGGQGLDYLGTPDGRPGWATCFLRRGHAVYVVDRTGHGRAPYHPDLHGALTPPPSYAFMLERFVAPAGANWPGEAAIGDAVLDQFMAGQGPMAADIMRAHADMRRGAEALLDRIGPAVLLTHSAGAPFGWLAADARPGLVRGIVAVEPQGPAFAQTPAGPLAWGLTATPLLFDPPAADPAELARATLPAPRPGLEDCLLQAEPARSLANLRDVPVLVVTGEKSWKARQDHGVVAFLRQAGVPAEHLRLEEVGLPGRGHMMMIERDSDAVAERLAGWIETRGA